MALIMESRWVTVGGIRTHCLIGGEGSPLVLLNGGGATTAEKDWAPNLNALAQHHRVYAPDMVGYGKTDKPRVDYTDSFFVQFFEGLINTLELERMSLVGHSLGGGVALAFTLKHPDKVDRLVLIDSSGLSNDLGLIARSLLAIFKIKARIRKDETYLSLVTGGRNGEPHEIFMDRLPEITAPTLICWGQCDRFMSVKLAYEAHARLRNSRLRVFEKAGHAPHRERAEEFNRLVLDFLRQ